MLLFGDVNNTIVQGSIFLVSTWTTCITLRLLYLFSDQTSLLSILPDFLRLYLPSSTLFPASFRLPPHLTIILYGHRLVRFLSILYLCLTLFLLYRIDAPLSSSFLSLTETSRGYWALVRVVLSSLLTLLISSMDSHFILRLITAVLIPPACLLDLISQLAHTALLACPTLTLITPTSSPSSTYSLDCDPAFLPTDSVLRFFAWRDVVSASVGLVLLGLGYWVIGLYGWVSDEVRMWSYEYQHWALDMKRRRGAGRVKKKKEPLLSSLFA
jgi:hypothetical protein